MGHWWMALISTSGLCQLNASHFYMSAAAIRIISKSLQILANTSFWVTLALLNLSSAAFLDKMTECIATYCCIYYGVGRAAKKDRSGVVLVLKMPESIWIS